MSDSEENKSDVEEIEEVEENEEEDENEDEESLDSDNEEVETRQQQDDEAKPAKKAKPTPKEKGGEGKTKKKTSKSAAPRKFEDYFCQEARAVAAELKRGKPEVRDKSGKLVSAAVPPMPGIPENDQLEEFKNIYDKLCYFTGEETQDTSRFVILHKERATAYASLIEKTKDKDEDNKWPEIATMFTNPKDFPAWRDSLKEDGMLVTAEHHRIILEKSTGAVYWLIDATRLEAAGRHFLRSLRGAQHQLKTTCKSQIDAARTEYEERGHSLEDQDADDYDPENVKTHVFVQLSDIQKRTIYPEARAFLHSLSDAKNKLRMYDDVTCHIPSHILIPHLYTLMKNAERRKSGASGSTATKSSKTKEGSAPADDAKNKRLPRPKMSTQRVQEPIVRPASSGNDETATSKMLSLAATGTVQLDKLSTVKEEFIKNEVEAAARLKAYQDNLHEVLSAFNVRVEPADSSQRKIMDELSLNGAPAKYIERLFGHPDPEERKKRITGAKNSASKCIEEALAFDDGEGEEEDSAKLEKLQAQSKKLNEQLEALADVYSMADAAGWRALLKEEDGRAGPVNQFAGYLAAPNKRALARKFFMPALLLGADIVDRMRSETADKLAGVITGLITGYSEESRKYKETMQAFSEICTATAHGIQNQSRAEKEKAAEDLKAACEKIDQMHQLAQEATKLAEERHKELSELKKKLAARDKEIAELKAGKKKEEPKEASKPKAIAPDAKPAEKRKEAPVTNGSDAKKKAKEEDKKEEKKDDKKGEKRKDPPATKTPPKPSTTPSAAPKKDAPTKMDEDDGGF